MVGRSWVHEGPDQHVRGRELAGLLDMVMPASGELNVRVRRESENIPLSGSARICRVAPDLLVVSFWSRRRSMMESRFEGRTERKHGSSLLGAPIREEALKHRIFQLTRTRRRIAITIRIARIR
jgi:hypothetical protein